MTESTTTLGKPSCSIKLVLLGEAAVGKSSIVSRFAVDDFQENREPTIGAAFLTRRYNLPDRVVKFEVWDTAGQERFASLAPMYYRNAQASMVVYDITKASSLDKAKHWVIELKQQASPQIIIALVGNKLDLARPANAVDQHPAILPNTGATAESSPASTELKKISRDDKLSTSSDQDIHSSSSSSKSDLENSHSKSHDSKTNQPENESSSSVNDRVNNADPTDTDTRQISYAQAKAFADKEGLLFFEVSAKTGQNVHDTFQAIAQAVPETLFRNPRSGSSDLVNSINRYGNNSDRSVRLTDARDSIPADECSC